MARLRVLAVALLILILASVASQLEPPRHVNPGQLQWRPPAGLDVMNAYSLVFKLIEGFNFEKALENLSLVNEASLPENLRYVAARVNSLMESTIRLLNETRASLDIAWGYFNRSSFKESQDWLDRAERSLREASTSHLELRDAARQVATLGIPVGRFEGELARVGDVIKRLEEEIEALRVALMKARWATETRLTIWVNATEVNVGGWIEVRGVLVDVTGAPLEGRSVLVCVGSKVFKAVTGGSGFFNVTSRVLDYRRYIEVYAEFTPVGGDVFNYTYSRSDTVTVEVFYLTPRLEVALSRERALPMDSVTLYIKSEPYACLIVKSLLLNRTLCLDSSGVTSLNIMVDPRLDEGVYSIRVNVTPKDLLGPASESVQLKIHRLNLTLRTEAPRALIAGVRGDVRVYVDANSDVRLCIESLQCFETRGSATVFRVGVPVTYIRDSVKLSVVAEPLDPRFKRSSVEFEVRVYNPLAMVTLLALVVAAVAMPSAVILKTLRSKGYPREAPPVELVAGAPRRVESPRGELESLLEELSHLTKTLYGVGLRAGDTFREYLSRLTAMPAGLREVLGEALMLLERALYGKPEDSKAILDRALKMLRRVLDLLRGALG